MTIERTISFKIISFDLDKQRFENLIDLLNTMGFKFKVSEIPCYGFQDNKHNIRINLFPKNIVEFISFYNKNDELKFLKQCIEVFLDNSILYFKAISMRLGRIYINEGDIKFKYIKPEFSNDNCLKYKVNTEIQNDESGYVVLLSNYHFYNFYQLKNENGIKGIIKTEILNKIRNFVETFDSCIED